MNDATHLEQLVNPCTARIEASVDVSGNRARTRNVGVGTARAHQDDEHSVEDHCYRAARFCKPANNSDTIESQ